MTQGYNTTPTRDVFRARSQKEDMKSFLDNSPELGRAWKRENFREVGSEKGKAPHSKPLNL